MMDHPSTRPNDLVGCPHDPDRGKPLMTVGAARRVSHCERTRQLAGGSERKVVAAMRAVTKELVGQRCRHGTPSLLLRPRAAVWRHCCWSSTPEATRPVGQMLAPPRKHQRPTLARRHKSGDRQAPSGCTVGARRRTRVHAEAELRPIGNDGWSADDTPRLEIGESQGRAPRRREPCSSVDAQLLQSRIGAANRCGVETAAVLISAGVNVAMGGADGRGGDAGVLSL